MVEEATHAGYPMDAAAVLLIELEGLREAVEEQAGRSRGICQTLRRARSARGALVRGARVALEGPQERIRRGGPRQPDVLRAGWRGAADARSRPRCISFREVSDKYGLTISNIFHAGDGNMHPIILFNAHKPGELEKAKAAGEEILELVHLGGRLHHRRARRRHGEERADAASVLRRHAGMMARLKTLFDPENRLNPGKMLPTGRGCMEIRQAPLTDSARAM